MENVIFGTDLMLFRNQAEKPVALGAATSCKLDVSVATLETSSKDSGKWVEKKAGKISWTASSENLCIFGEYRQLYEIMITREPVEIEFSTVANASVDGVPVGGWTSKADGLKGNAIITSISLNAPDGDNATYSVSFEGVGALKEA